MNPAALVLCAALSVIVLGGASHSGPQPAQSHLRADGRFFRAADGSRFSWRGLTAFRLVEQVASGRESEAAAVLDWAAAHGVTVVRVLTMADVLFKLSPESGRQALPRLLSLAAQRRLVVEAVALADTDRIPVPLGEQVQAVGTICAAHANCTLEIANEPWARHTQREGLGRPAALRSLRELVPAGVPVSLGSASSDESGELSGGDYVTVHVAREEGDGGWRTVSRTRVAGALSLRTGKPVVDDEPIGAAETSEPGRRDADVDHWFARGAAARLLAIGATFHYEGGLHGTVPMGQEAACFEAWRKGLDALPADLEDVTVAKTAGEAGAAVQHFDSARVSSVLLAEGKDRAWALAVGVTGDPKIAWRAGWRVVDVRKEAGVWIVAARRLAR